MISKSSLPPRRSFLGILPASGSPLSRLGLLSPGELSHLVRRERMRSMRRGIGFCMLLFRRDRPVDATTLERLVRQFQNRLRLTDDLGILDDQLVVLLPDTDQAGAQLVANDLLQIAREFDLNLDCQVVTDDDPGQTNGRPDFDGQPHYRSSPTGQSLLGNTDNGTSMAVATLPETRRRQVEIPAGLKCRDLFVRPVPVWKRAIDLLGASAGLVALSPVFLLAAIAIARESRGGVFFRQLREGKDGKVFWIYKFRTMHDGADLIKDSLRQHSEQDGPAFKMTDDPRVTATGRFLRKSCVDELPQLINVIRGDMSLVGPRPLPVNESQACEDWQRDRLEVLPGMTCTWQVEGKRDIPFRDWMRMDLSYMRKQSLLFDVGLLFRTALVALRMKGSV